MVFDEEIKDKTVVDQQLR